MFSAIRPVFLCVVDFIRQDPLGIMTRPGQIPFRSAFERAAFIVCIEGYFFKPGVSFLVDADIILRAECASPLGWTTFIKRLV